MNADNFGSFSIACRLMRALSTVGKEDPTNRRPRVLQSFFEKYSTAPSDLTTLLELLLARVDSEAIAASHSAGSLPLSATERELAEGLMDDWLIRCGDAMRLAHIPFASFGNLSLSEARDAVVCLQSIGGIAGRPGGDPATTLRGETVGKDLPASITPEEWIVLKNIACGDAHANVGPHTTEGDLIGILGPVATTVYGTQGRHVRNAVQAASDGSPRMMRESSCTAYGAADDAAAGFASDPEDDAHVPSTAAPLEMGSKRPREEDAGGAAGSTWAAQAQKAFEATPSARLDTAAVPGHTTAARARMYPCMYGSACRRTNPAHFMKYSHPAMTTAAPAPGTAGTTPETPVPPPPPSPPGPSPSPTAPSAAAPATPLDPAMFAVLGVVPLRAMKEHEFVFADNSGGGYKMKNCGGGTYTCNCPVWRYQNKATNERTCKHLQTFLGDAFERARCGGGDAVVGASVALAGGAAAAPKRPGSPTVGGRKVAMPGVLLANKGSNKGDYKEWWVSEKLDGVRAYWDGTNLLSRNGNIFTAPESFIKALPVDRTLDGELFGGRKRFQTTVGIVKSSAAHPGWATLTYEVFDTPSSGEKPFETRMAELSALFPNNGPVKHVHVVEQTRCTGAQYVSDRLAEVEAVGGEGLMLREPGSRYVHSRSNTLLKIKSTEEVDAIVRGHDPGKGKNAGRCGALLAELANGKQFCVGSGLSDAQRNAPPPVGTVIVVKFQELTDGGIPRFPVFVGCRFDIDWPPKGKPAS